MKTYKYPRTYHLPSSPGCTSDDKKLPDDSIFQDKHVVVPEKMDGENITMYTHTIHQRSMDSHCSEDYNSRVKSLWASVRHDIPPDMRICGEAMPVVHSIKYDNLPDHFLVFSIWCGDVCLSWQETILWCDLLGLTPVPMVYEGVYDKDAIQASWEALEHESEGYVVRLSESFADFDESVAKWVRKDHVQTDKHWKSKKKEFNTVRETR